MDQKTTNGFGQSAELDLVKKLEAKSFKISLINDIAIQCSYPLVAFPSVGVKSWRLLKVAENSCPICSRAFPYTLEFCHFDGAELQLTSAGGERI